jgi:hypothetical protein
MRCHGAHKKLIIRVHQISIDQPDGQARAHRCSALRASQLSLRTQYSSKATQLCLTELKRCHSRQHWSHAIRTPAINQYFTRFLSGCSHTVLPAALCHWRLRATGMCPQWLKRHCQPHQLHCRLQVTERPRKTAHREWELHGCFTVAFLHTYMPRPSHPPALTPTRSTPTHPPTHSPGRQLPVQRLVAVPLQAAQR